MARQRLWRHRTSLFPAFPVSDKASLRETLLARRAGADPALGARLTAHVMPLCPEGVAVAGFWPMGDEIDVRPLLIALHRAGHSILLPETPPPGEALRFRRWWPGVAMVTERFGTMRPDAPEGEPGLLLVPLLGFDRQCHRIGYGGGYYDRTIAAWPGIRTIGCAYALQEVDAVPILPHDAPLDAVATEVGVIWRSRT